MYLRSRRPHTLSPLGGRHRGPLRYSHPGRSPKVRSVRPRKSSPLARWIRARAWLLSAATACLLVAGLFTIPRPSQALLSIGPPPFSPSEQPVPDGVIEQLMAISLTSLVDASKTKRLLVSPPAALPSVAPRLGSDDKPDVLFLCSENNGFCGDVSWPLVIALDKFGAFSRLGFVIAHGNHNPGTVGFDFYHSSYSSPYIAFTAVEMSGNEKLPDGGWVPLQKLTRAEAHIFYAWDIPPYSSPAYSVPFIDFGGRSYMASPGFGGQGLDHLSPLPGKALALALDNVMRGKARLPVFYLAARIIGAICIAAKNAPPPCHRLPSSLEKLSYPVNFNQEVGPPEG
jgi:hypothetical protein